MRLLDCSQRIGWGTLKFAEVLVGDRDLLLNSQQNISTFVHSVSDLKYYEGRLNQPI